MNKIKSKIKSEFLNNSLANHFSACNNHSKKTSFIVPLSNLEYVSKHSNSDLERYYLQQVIHTLKIREAEELFKLLSPLKKGSCGLFFSGDSSGIFVPQLEETYQIPDEVHYSVNISFLENGEVDIDNGRKLTNYYAKVEMWV